MSSLRLHIAKRWAVWAEAISDWFAVLSIRAIRRVRRIEGKDRRDDR